MKLHTFTEKIVRAQIAHPWRFLGLAFVVTLVAVVAASTLRFDSSYQALLPRDSPEIIVAHDIQERTGGTQQLVVAIGGDDEDARLEFGRRLERRLDGLEGIRVADLQFPVDFFHDRGLWLLETEELVELADAAEQAVEIYRTRRDPTALGLFWGRVSDTLESRRGTLPYDGVMTSHDGQYTFLLVTPSIRLYDLSAGRVLLQAIQEQVDELDPESSGLHIEFAGTQRLYQEQHQRIGSDLRNASIVAFVLGVLLVAGFTRRPLAPVVVGLSLVPGIVWTFAITRAFTDHVNMVTGFLVAVLVGLGIDFGIHLYVRFQQEFIRTNGRMEKALKSTVVGTLPPALTSAATTSGTFFAFGIAKFPGFYEFGLVAGAGVLLTLASTFLVLPPLIVVSGRRAVSALAVRGLIGVRALRPGESQMPVKVAAFLILVFMAAAIYGAINISGVPFRNNFRAMRGHSAAMEFTEYVNQSLGAGFSPAVILVSTPEEAAQVVAFARELEDREPASADNPRIGQALSVADLVPTDIEARRVQIQRLRQLLNDPSLRTARQEGVEGSEHLETAVRIVNSEPWTAQELPEEFRRRFFTLDGRDSIAYVWPTIRVDADFQALAWEEELNRLTDRMRDADIAYTMVDETLISAWISRVVLADAPRVLPLAVLVVFIFLLFDFRSFREASFVACPLLVGMLCFIGTAHALGLELNMFNMVVVPSVIGIGIDAVVHIYHRYRIEGRGSVVFIMRTTGSAVFLASLTTAIGFGSSLICFHRGLQSLGRLAIIGIAFTFLSAMLFFPALLTLVERIKRRHS